MRKTTSVSQSREGFPSHLWGPGLWTFIHMIALNVRLHPTPQEKQAYADFFKSLQQVLPCGTCRREFTKMTRHIPKNVFLTRSTAFAWTVRLHHAVSRRLNKVQDLSPAIDWAAYYESKRHHPDPPAPIRSSTKVLVEYNPQGPEDARRIRTTLGRFHGRRVILRITRTLPVGSFRLMRSRVFVELADVLRVLS
jgi:hypothetical protein